MAMDDLQREILEMGGRARKAALALGNLSTERKNAILESMADALVSRQEAILQANAADLAAGQTSGLAGAMVDRLRLDAGRIGAMADGIRQVAALSDPVGEILGDWTRPNGMRIVKRRVALGVIGIIYESRPNVTSDAAVLCFKSGNATILRGGKEAIHSNGAIANALDFGGSEAGMPEGAIQLIRTTDRATVQHLARMDQYLDVIIPRGGKGLIETVVSLARMPVIKHYDGICHVYVDKDADLEMAKSIVINSKTQKPSVCNALETLLVHRDVAEAFYGDGGRALLEAGVELRGDALLEKTLPGQVRMAAEEDWTTEYLDLILAVKTVDSLAEAVDHINAYGSGHSDCIVTKENEAAERFLNEVDSAAVFWNTSTRFSDGEEFGFGAEIGISTDKLHARGPMALPELTSYKYLITSDGQLK